MSTMIKIEDAMSALANSTNAFANCDVTPESIDAKDAWEKLRPIDKFMRVMSDAKCLSDKDYAMLSEMLSKIYPIP